jgi:hypothetical protein
MHDEFRAIPVTTSIPRPPGVHRSTPTYTDGAGNTIATGERPVIKLG